jgi:hypothetical protein
MPLQGEFSNICAEKSFAWDAASSVAELKYPGGVSAKVRIENRQAYLRFELLSVEPRDGVEAIIWGPYPPQPRQMDWGNRRRCTRRRLRYRRAGIGHQYNGRSSR